MAKWTSPVIEVVHEVGRESPLGKVLTMLVETGRVDYRDQSSVVGAIERYKIEALQQQFILVGLALAGCIQPGCQIEDREVEAVCYAFQDLRSKFNDLLN